MEIDKQFYKLDTLEGIAEVLKYLECRGVKVIWGTITPSKPKLEELVAFSSIRGTPIIPSNIYVYTNETVNSMKNTVRKVLGVFRANEVYDESMNDNVGALKIKSFFENGNR